MPASRYILSEGLKLRMRDAEDVENDNVRSDIAASKAQSTIDHQIVNSVPKVPKNVKISTTVGE